LPASGRLEPSQALQVARRRLFRVLLTNPQSARRFLHRVIFAGSLLPSDEKRRRRLEKPEVYLNQLDSPVLL
jgi:hypothetical protein